MKNVISIVFFFLLLIFLMSKCGSCSKEADIKEYNGTSKDTALERINKANLANIEMSEAITLKKFVKSKAGKLQKKHPSWTVDECNNVIAKQIWIGMEYDMVVAERGRPNKINKSNYGTGINYQFCWEGYETNYFYSKDDLIITAYN